MDSVSATSCCTRTSRARTRSRTRACARRSTRRSTSRRSRAKVMRGMSAPSALLISPLLFSRAAEFKRHPYDVDGGQEAAGRGRLSERLRGRRWTARTTATSTTRRSARRSRAMLARVDVKVQAQRAAEGQVLREGRDRPAKYDSSFNLLGWTPGSFDSWNVLANIIGCRDADGKGGHVQLSAATAIPRSTSSTKQDPGREPTPPSATSMIAEAFQHRPRGGRHHPAAPAGARLGRVEEGQDRAARRQPDPVLLGERRSRVRRS